MTEAQGGLWGGMVQPSIRRNFSFDLSRAADFDRLDAWLLEVFAVTIGPPLISEHVDLRDAAARKAANLVNRLSHLARELLWRARFASFDPCFIQGLKIDPDKNVAHAEVRLPYYDTIPEKLFDRCYGLAWVAIRDFLDATTVVDLDALSDRFQNELFDPGEKVVPGGLSTVTLLMAAHQRNIPFRPVAGRVYQLGHGARARWLDRSGIDTDSVIGASLSQNKAFTASVLRTAGLPVPRHVLVYSENEAVRAIEALGYPLVTKPADRDLGNGVTVNLIDEKQVRQGYRTATEFSPAVLVEEQVPGICHRLLVVNGRVIYANNRRPLHVIGNGVATIGALVDDFNSQEARKIGYLRHKPIPKDDDALAFLKSAGWNINDIPREDERVALRPIESSAWGGRGEDVTTKMHPENAKLARRAARQMRLAVAGIDLMIDDISIPWYRCNAKINEVNPFPLIGIRLPHNRAAALEYMGEFFADGGRIPVSVLVGNEKAYDTAVSLQQADLKRGVAAHACSHDRADGPDWKSRTRGGAGLVAQVANMLSKVEVERLYIVVQNDEILRAGLPIDRFDELVVVNDDIGHAASVEEATRSARFGELVELLKARVSH